MKCPYCNKEMAAGVVQSARQIFFTNKAHTIWSAQNKTNNDEVLLSSNNWTGPTCNAFHCADCKKVVIDYSEK